MWMVISALTLGSAHAAEVIVGFDIDESKANQFDVDPSEVENDLNDEIDRALNLDDVDGFLNSMANAASIAQKGMGVSYTMDKKNKAIFGGGFGTGVHANGISFGKGKPEIEGLPQAGFATQVMLMGGFSLGGITGADEKAFSRRVFLYANGLYLPLPSSKAFSGTMYGVGAHLQVRMGGIDAKVLEWNGISLTTGFERTGYTLNLNNGFDVNADPFNWRADGEYSVASTVDAVPVELSTSVRAAIVTAFVGGGFDYVLNGVADGSAALSGPVDVSVPDVGEENIGSANVTLTGQGLADPQLYRVFVGAELQLLVLRLYGQLNVGFNSSAGGHIGARIVL